MSSLNTNIGPERVQVFDQPLGSVQIPGAATAVTAYMVATSFPGAPVNTPTTVQDQTTFNTLFGGADDLFFDAYYAVKGYYDNAGLGASAIIVNVGDGTHQQTTITTVADVSGSLAGTNFTISSGRDKKKYYVWYQVSGVGTDPLVSGRTGLKVSISTNATANTVASATQAVLNAATGLSATVLTNTVTVTNTGGGPSTNAADGTPATGFTIATPLAGANPTANDFIGSGSLGTGIRALDTVDTVDLLEAPGLPLSMAYLVDPATIDYTKTVRAEFGATLSTSFSLLAIPKVIRKANTNVQQATGTVSTVVGSVVTFAATAPSLATVTPGMVAYSAATFIGTVTAVSDSAHTVTLTSTGTLASTNPLTIYTPSAIVYKERVVNDPSRVAAWYYNNVLVLDATAAAPAGTLYTSSPLGHVAGVIARIDANTSIGGVSHAPAGLQFAGLSGIQGLSLTVSERLDGGPLRLNFINRLTSFPGAGNVIFGGYTADSGTSPLYTADEQLIQVMRSLQFVKASLEPGLRSFLWENFSPVTQGRIANAIQSFMRNNIYLFPAGLPESQQFRIISITPTQDELNQGLLRVRVQVRPNKAVRFIEVTLEFPLASA